jgi:large subunit ribosomal protein L32
MAVPKKKRTVRRIRNRNAHMVIEPMPLTRCTNCNKLIPSHHVCKFCGYYNDEKIVILKEKENKQAA